jgi:hypothetical protein
VIYIHDDEVELDSRRKYWSSILQMAEREAFEAYVAAGKQSSCKSDEDIICIHTHTYIYIYTTVCYM